MDMYRAFLAIIISFLILVGYQYLFVPSPVEQPAVSQEAQQPPDAGKQDAGPAVALPPAEATKVDPAAREITVETPLYTAVIHEQGGGIKSFVLKGYNKELKAESGAMQLVQTSLVTELPMLFSLRGGTPEGLPVYRAEKEKITVAEVDGKTSLIMQADLAGDIRIVRTLVFDPASYLIGDSYRVENGSSVPVSTQPAVVLTNKPFSAENAASRFMFSGPVALVNGSLAEVKGKKLSKGTETLQGEIGWTAYEDNYFICAILPETAGNRTVTLSAQDETVRTVLSDEAAVLDPAAAREFNYSVYFGPKKLTLLKQVDQDLSKAINFGWFDVLAKPMLWLLNFFYDFIGNYGIAIILLTVVIKGVFWPITQKGMKSMKNMQKLQPKVAKLKEKYKGDPQKMNQEMMALYKTYKVNPLGGCLPLLLQIPFFFALYKVLLMSIELRHAPFMLWINDLAAPDRLWVGFDIPFLHGIPVLTLLMGASMYLQQKMTPTTADPTQAKIMQMLPIIFTFMFLNFASGLVLYWFVNNLLSILQQQLINRQTRA
ncbi:MAG TPA: membrane protein insertase YidC [Desulfobulbaceae bacterium]|nr:membrane protein insertase YidC [Desulfobulbaceae bacterium]